jgi:rhamnosyltransferase subunit B
MLTHAPYRAMAVEAGMEFVPIDTKEEYESDMREQQLLFEGLFRKPMAVTRYYERSAWYAEIPREFAAITERYIPGQTAVIARHTSGVSALMAAEVLDVPVAWVAVWPTQIQALPLMQRIFEYKVGAKINQLRSEVGLGPISDWGAWFNSADLKVGLWPEWFDSAGATVPADFQLTDFVSHSPAESGEIPPEAEELLSSGSPPVLIAGGSSMVTNEAFYPTAAEACVRAGRVGLLVCPHRQHVPDPLPPGIHWFSRLPFREVMPRVSAVIHHGGISTITRALTSRTPQVILPWGFDRPDNAARLGRHRLAHWLPVSQWTPDRVAELLLSTDDLLLEPPEPIDSVAAARSTARLLAALPEMRRVSGSVALPLA